MYPLSQLAGRSGAQAGNVAYNAVGLLDELVQILYSKDRSFDSDGAVGRQHLIEDGGQVHGGGDVRIGCDASRLRLADNSAGITVAADKQPIET